MSQDFEDFLVELVTANARFLVVGAHALSVHGVPRATVDLDVWIDRTAENVACVWRALSAFGAPLADLKIRKDDLTRPDVVIQLGLPPLRIDILTSLSGITFDEAWPNRVQDRFANVPVPFLGREALIRNKRATGRHKDLGDLESLGEE
ncbi:MAG: hypothetical protein ACRENQ_12750 [Gemmatimonadaceae bacterium]